MQNSGMEKSRVERTSVNGGRERPDRAEAEDAVRTLIAWAGDDPAREGLLKTPRRVVEAFEEYFSGYEKDPADLFKRTFKDAGGYDDMIMLTGIRVNSHCEHHMAPFLGIAQVAYVPDKKVAGISKLARAVEIFARRLQTQEILTAQIGKALEKYLTPKGTAVLIKAEHQCMTTRGICRPGVKTLTTHFTGLFETDAALGQRFMRLAETGEDQ